MLTRLVHCGGGQSLGSERKWAGLRARQHLLAMSLSRPLVTADEVVTLPYENWATSCSTFSSSSAERSVGLTSKLAPSCELVASCGLVFNEDARPCDAIIISFCSDHPVAQFICCSSWHVRQFISSLDHVVFDDCGRKTENSRRHLNANQSHNHSFEALRIFQR